MEEQDDGGFEICTNAERETCIRCPDLAGTCNATVIVSAFPAKPITEAGLPGIAAEAGRVIFTAGDVQCYLVGTREEAGTAGVYALVFWEK